MSQSELMKELRGDQTQEQFAQRLGVGQATISLIESGQRAGGLRLVSALLRAFPKRRSDIMETFFASEYCNRK